MQRGGAGGIGNIGAAIAAYEKRRAEQHPGLAASSRPSPAAAPRVRSSNCSSTLVEELGRSFGNMASFSLEETHNPATRESKILLRTSEGPAGKLIWTQDLSTGSAHVKDFTLKPAWQGRRRVGGPKLVAS